MKVLSLLGSSGVEQYIARNMWDTVRGIKMRGCAEARARHAASRAGRLVRWRSVPIAVGRRVEGCGLGAASARSPEPRLQINLANPEDRGRRKGNLSNEDLKMGQGRQDERCDFRERRLDN